MLIPGKSHSRDESHNSRVSIETLDFARVRTFTCVIGVGSPAGARMGGGVITGRIRRRSQSITGPHCRLRTINIAGSGAPKRPGEGTGKRNSHRLPDDGPGITASPHQTSVDNRSTSRAGWVRETAGSGRVSGAMAHLSKSRRAARRRAAIADRMPGMGDHRPTVRRGRTIGRHCGRSAQLMSALTRL